MGGLGSGRFYYLDCKLKTEDYRALDIRKWLSRITLIPGISFTYEWYSGYELTSEVGVTVGINMVMLMYKYRDPEYNWRIHNYPIHIVWSTCNYGGARPWFLCPAPGCNRRVAVLYGGEIFACRHCYQLAYKCQSESPSNRAIRRANKIRGKLHWEPGILNGEGIKPKGMHLNTFERLYNQHQNFVSCSPLGLYGYIL